MDTLSASEAASLLHLNVKRIQSLARAGKLPAVRVGRKWLFPRQQLESLLRGSTLPPQSHRDTAVSPPVDLSARNQLRGRITALHLDGVMAEIRIQIGDQELVSVITRGSAERMGLAVGDEVLAVIKSTEVMIGRGTT
jgi:molybdopterin-binding protein